METEAHAGRPVITPNVLAQTERQVHAFAKRYGVHKHEEIDDLLSIANEALVYAQTTFKEDRLTKFSTWAYRLVSQAIGRAYRDTQASLESTYVTDMATLEEMRGAPLFMEYPDEPEDVVFGRELRGLVAAHLRELPEDERTALVHTFGLYGAPVLSQEEIADAIHVSQSAVSRKVTRALMRLRVAGLPETAGVTADDYRNPTL